MAKYHISPKTGRPNKCHASVKSCPVGGEGEHYPTKEAAAEAFEKRMKASEVPATRGKKAAREEALAKLQEERQAEKKKRFEEQDTKWQAQLAREEAEAAATLDRYREEARATLASRQPKGFGSKERYEAAVEAEVEERLQLRESALKKGYVPNTYEHVVSVTTLRKVFKDQQAARQDPERERREELSLRRKERKKLLEALASKHSPEELLAAERELQEASKQLVEVRASAFYRLRKRDLREPASKSEELVRDRELLEEANGVTNTFAERLLKLSPLAQEVADSFRGRNGDERYEDSENRARDYELAMKLLQRGRKWL